MRTVRTMAVVMTSIAIAAGVAACSSSSGSTAKSAAGQGSAAAGGSAITIGLVQGQDFTHAMPARIAAAQGIFAKNGLDVTIVAFTSGSDLTKAMVGGSVDVGAATGLDVVTAAAKGIDMQAFFGVRTTTPMSLIVSSKSSVTSFATLKGKKLGISAFGSMTDFDAKLIAKQQNVSLTEVPLGAPSANLAALQKGDVAATLLPVDFSYPLAANGTGKVVASVKDLGQPDQFGILMASGKYLSSHAGAIKSLVTSYSEAIKFIQANKAATVAVEQSALGKTAATASETYDALAAGFTADGTMSTAGLQAYAQALPELKIAAKAPSQSSYYNSSFTPVS